DAHLWTVRLDVNYSFETIFDLLPKCIVKLLVSNKITLS
ncbi:peptidase M20, partial [Bacillus cereus]|nr:peptidase M20 [Bacillus cereus]